MKPADFLSDAYGMLQYCYQHDEWSNTEKALEAQLANDRWSLHLGIAYSSRIGLTLALSSIESPSNIFAAPPNSTNSFWCMNSEFCSQIVDPFDRSKRSCRCQCETVNHMSDIERQASALVKRPQPFSVLIRITLSHRLNKTAINVSILWEDLVPAIRRNPTIMITSKLSREKLLKPFCSPPPIQASFQGLCLLLRLLVEAFSGKF
jgi:hypothetical protein